MSVELFSSTGKADNGERVLSGEGQERFMENPTRTPAATNAAATQRATAQSSELALVGTLHAPSVGRPFDANSPGRLRAAGFAERWRQVGRDRTRDPGRTRSYISSCMDWTRFMIR